MNNPCDFEVVSAKLSVECFATGNAKEILFKVHKKELFKTLNNDVVCQQGWPNIDKSWSVELKFYIAKLFSERDRLNDNDNH